jgi:hypothetical protein
MHVACMLEACRHVDPCVSGGDRFSPPPSRKAWIDLPAKPQINRGGTARTDARSGKQLYTPVLELKDRTARERFQQVAFEAARALIGEGMA